MSGAVGSDAARRTGDERAAFALLRHKPCRGPVFLFAVFPDRPNSVAKENKKKLSWRLVADLRSTPRRPREF